MSKITASIEANKKVIYDGHNFPGKYLNFDVGVNEEDFYVIAYVKNAYLTRNHDV
jgi:hypothetical protein